MKYFSKHLLKRQFELFHTITRLQSVKKKINKSINQTLISYSKDEREREKKRRDSKTLPFHRYRRYFFLQNLLLVIKFIFINNNINKYWKVNSNKYWKYWWRLSLTNNRFSFFLSFFIVPTYLLTCCWIIGVSRGKTFLTKRTWNDVGN